MAVSSIFGRIYCLFGRIRGIIRLKRVICGQETEKNGRIPDNPSA